MAIGGPQAPTYLARRSYRQRRLRDAARMLPLLGTILWLFPLMAPRPQTGATMIYVFGVWVILILLAAMLARRIRHEPDQAETLRDT